MDGLGCHALEIWANILIYDFVCVESKNPYFYDKPSTMKKTLLAIILAVNAALAQNSRLTEIWENEAWKNSKTITYEYLAGVPSQELHQVWNGLTESWLNQTRTLYTDQSIVQRISLTQNWIPETQIWVDDFRVTTLFVDQIIRTKEAWTGSSWINSERSIDEIVPQTSSTLTHQIWTSGAWTNSHRTITTFGPNESEMEVINQNWDGTQWVNVSRHEVTVLADSQSTTQTIDQVWEADAWVNVVRTLAQNLSENQHQSQFFNWQDQWQLDSRTVITTTGDNYHSLSENYEAGDDQWIPYAQHFRVIDELDEIKTFQNFIGNWINDYRETTNWSGILQDERPSRNVVSVYPNPSADTIHVSALQTVQSYTLFGINGQLIKSGKPTNDQFSIDISTLKNGVYILNADGNTLRIIKR